ncbi:hypothetical protein GQ55_1G098000 [Panicum hallii var. hallii]|uniref:Uncharacterized protein n=1 Tax=Panicum hallii var. hallii TaxID=1504633 RepID=A0A2T7F443_9POAL|nr:hypothetical protein GQ55_1G098000 [Panicum hallii var. hallii]
MCLLFRGQEIHVNIYQFIHALEVQGKKRGEIIGTAPRCISTSGMYILHSCLHFAASKAGKLICSQLRQPAASLKRHINSGGIVKEGSCKSMHGEPQQIQAEAGLLALPAPPGGCRCLPSRINTNDWALLVPSGLLPRGQATHTCACPPMHVFCTAGVALFPRSRAEDNRPGRPASRKIIIFSFCEEPEGSFDSAPATYVS